MARRRLRLGRLEPVDAFAADDLGRVWREPAEGWRLERLGLPVGRVDRGPVGVVEREPGTGGGAWIECFRTGMALPMVFSISRRLRRSSWAQNVIAWPLAPARPLRPIRWT